MRPNEAIRSRNNVMQGSSGLISGGFISPVMLIGTAMVDIYSRSLPNSLKKVRVTFL